MYPLGTPLSQSPLNTPLQLPSSVFHLARLCGDGNVVTWYGRLSVWRPCEVVQFVQCNAVQTAAQHTRHVLLYL